MILIGLMNGFIWFDWPIVKDQPMRVQLNELERLKR
mgnify:CR=1 FL=1